MVRRSYSPKICRVPCSTPHRARFRCFPLDLGGGSILLLAALARIGCLRVGATQPCWRREAPEASEPPPLLPSVAIREKSGDSEISLGGGAGVRARALPRRSRSAVQAGRTLAGTDRLPRVRGRPHLFLVGEGWEEVAAAIDSWLDDILDAPDWSAQ